MSVLVEGLRRTLNSSLEELRAPGFVANMVRAIGLTPTPLTWYNQTTHTRHSIYGEEAKYKLGREYIMQEGIW